MTDATAPAAFEELTAQAREALRSAWQALRAGQRAQALRHADAARAIAPRHPDPLRVIGIVLNAEGRHGEARAILEQALAARPDDAAILLDLGVARMACGEREAAYAHWRRAGALAPAEPMPWFNLGRNLQLEGRTGEAVDALAEACARAPAFVPARILLGDALVHLGRFDAADAQYREALLHAPACGDAWRGLANIKTRALSEADRAQLASNADRADVAAHDRIAMRYALGKACEDQGDFDAAFAAIAAANAETRARSRWDARAFGRHVDALVATSAELPPPHDPSLGSEAILIVGLPRSGSTLFEQILAAHPEVEGGSELPDLAAVLDEESARRGQPFPHWAASANADDWRRLGHDYLQRTARWRERRPRFTDKMPENWRYAGVLRAMLPGARVIDARRDPLETGWSCFKQQFYRLPHFACDLADIGAYLRDCERTMNHWRAQAPDRIRMQSYEALLAQPEHEVRALLAFCGLAFDARCLDFHRVERSVRTASASQVRQPLRGDTARAARYGAKLDPLRAALADPDRSPSSASTPPAV